MSNPTFKDVLKLHQAELGYTETPVNYTKFNDEYFGYHRSAPWCVTYQQVIFKHANLPLPYRTASCTEFMDWCIEHGVWVTSGYREGDVAVVVTESGRHMVFLTKIYVNGANTIEGNWHNKVDTFYRPFATNFLGAYHPNYGKEEEDLTREEVQAIIDESIKRYKYLKDIPKWYKPTIQRLVAEGSIAGEGGSGENLIVNLTEDMCRTLVFMERHEEKK